MHCGLRSVGEYNRRIARTARLYLPDDAPERLWTPEETGRPWPNTTVKNYVEQGKQALTFEGTEAKNPYHESGVKGINHLVFAHPTKGLVDVIQNTFVCPVTTPPTLPTNLYFSY
jgi:hypothetical protein